MFWIGCGCGLLFAGLLWLIRRGALPPHGTVSRRSAKKGDGDGWAQTRNFLYYDGTEMPAVKEEGHE